MIQNVKHIAHVSNEDHISMIYSNLTKRPVVWFLKEIETQLLSELYSDITYKDSQSEKYPPGNTIIP